MESTISRIQKGILGSAPLLFFLFMFPKLMNDVFYWGVSNIPLIILVSVLPAGLIALFICRLKTEILIKIARVIPLITGILSIFTGLLYQVSINKDDIPTITVIAGLMFTGFLTAYIQLILHFSLISKNSSNESFFWTIIRFG